MTIIKKFEPDDQKSKLPRKYIAVVILSLFILTITEIWASNTLVTYGDKFENLSLLSKGLDMENRILENQIAKYSSLDTVASKSASLGFFASESIQYIR